MLRDQIIVVDVEATCWKGPPPPGEQNEIIEIGVCALDVTTGERLNPQSLLVKPTRSKVSAFCTELTTLTQEQVNGGMTFAEACARVTRDYRAGERLWGSWGDYDRKMFVAQCESFGVAYPFSAQHVNIKKLFGRLVKQARGMGMASALEVAGLTLEGTHHRGGDDALNIARLLWYSIEQRGLDVVEPYWRT